MYVYKRVDYNNPLPWMAFWETLTQYCVGATVKCYCGLNYGFITAEAKVSLSLKGTFCNFVLHSLKSPFKFSEYN